MKRFNISVPKKDKEDKTWWHNVGTLVLFEAVGEKPDRYLLELNMFPDTKFGVFEQKPKVSNDDEKFHQHIQQEKKVELTSPDPTTGEQMNPEDIPF